MRASLILHESSSNIVYFSGDREFIDHFKKIDNEWQKEAGFDGEGTFTLEKLVQHFFGLPSLFLQMKAYHTPFHGFTTEDKLNIQVVQMVGFFYVAFDNKRDLDFLHRKLHVLNSIIVWFIGPTMKYSVGGTQGSRCKLCPEYDSRFPNAQREAWYTVSCFLEIWEYLFFTDQAFMLEAYDKFVVNFNVTTKYKDILEIVTQTARIDKIFPSCSIIFVKNKILEFKEARDPTRDILHSSDLLLILILVNFLHPTKKLLQAIRYIDAQNGFFYPDSFYEPPKAESPPASPHGNSGTSPSDESYEDALMKPTTSPNNLTVREKSSTEVVNQNNNKKRHRLNHSDSAESKKQASQSSKSSSDRSQRCKSQYFDASEEFFYNNTTNTSNSSGITKTTATASTSTTAANTSNKSDRNNSNDTSITVEPKTNDEVTQLSDDHADQDDRETLEQGNGDVERTRKFSDDFGIPLSTAAATISTDFSNLDEPFPLDASSIDLDNDIVSRDANDTSTSPTNDQKRKSRSRTMPSISLGMHFDDLDLGRGEVVHKNSDASGSRQGSRTVTLLDPNHPETRSANRKNLDLHFENGETDPETGSPGDYPSDMSNNYGSPGSRGHLGSITETSELQSSCGTVLSDVTTTSAGLERQSSEQSYGVKKEELKYLPLSPVLMANLRKENHATLVNCMSKSGDARIPTNLFFVRIAVRDVVLMFATTHQHQHLARSITKMIQALDIIRSAGVVVAINPHQLSLAGMQQTHDEITNVFNEDDKHCREIQHFWANCCNRGLGTHLSQLNSVQFGDRLGQQVTEQLDSALENYQNCLKRLYEKVFLGSTFGMPNVKPEDFREFCAQISLNFMTRVRSEHGSRKDFHNFIQGRVASFKVILNTFPVTHPGLIHFVHVNRATNQITAPRLSEDRNRALMKHFYSFVAKCRQLLTRRASYAVWKDNQFTYSYSISFENRQYLDKVGSDKAISEEQMDNILDDRPVGFLSYNTYHQLKHSLFPGKKPGFDNIVATETFCIHLQELPTGFALRQNRKISDNVWDACYRKGISLA